MTTLDSLKRKVRSRLGALPSDPVLTTKTGKDGPSRTLATVTKRTPSRLNPEFMAALEAAEKVPETPFGHILNAQKRQYLEAVVDSAGNLSAAGRKIGVSPSTAFMWRKNDQEFADALEDAKLMAVEMLESEAVRRAYSGSAKGIWFKGTKVGSEQVYSDNLLMFMLKGAKPITYRDNSDITLNSGRGSGPFQITHSLIDEAIAGLQEMQEKMRKDEPLAIEGEIITSNGVQVVP